LWKKLNLEFKSGVFADCIRNLISAPRVKQLWRHCLVLSLFMDKDIGELLGPWNPPHESS
jgi:hypothetical protein